MVIKSKYFIKKFKDRKLYDCQQSEVVNFKRIIEMITKEDLPVYIIDHNNRDITNIVLVDCLSYLLKQSYNEHIITGKRTIVRLIKDISNGAAKTKG